MRKLIANTYPQVLGANRGSFRAGIYIKYFIFVVLELAQPLVLLAQGLEKFVQEICWAALYFISKRFLWASIEGRIRLPHVLDVIATISRLGWCML